MFMPSQRQMQEMEMTDAQPHACCVCSGVQVWRESGLPLPPVPLSHCPTVTSPTLNTIPVPHFPPFPPNNFIILPILNFPSNFPSNFGIILEFSNQIL